MPLPDTHPGSAAALDRLDFLFSTPAIPLHILLMGIGYGVLLPVGVLLGHIRHKLHAPIQALFAACAFFGAIAGYNHPHKPRPPTAHPTSHPPSLHVALAPWILSLLALQVLAGALRKWTKTTGKDTDGGYLVSLPKAIHRWLGRAHLLLAYVQCLTGVMKLLKPCPPVSLAYDCQSMHWAGSGLIFFGLALLVAAYGIYPLSSLPPSWHVLTVLTPPLLGASLSGSLSLSLPILVVSIHLPGLLLDGHPVWGSRMRGPLFLALSLALLGIHLAANPIQTPPGDPITLLDTDITLTRWMRALTAMPLFVGCLLSLGSAFLWHPWSQVTRLSSMISSLLIIFSGIFTIASSKGYTLLAHSLAWSHHGYLLLILLVALAIPLLLLRLLFHIPPSSSYARIIPT